MAQTTCIQCGSIYEEDRKFCPRDDTPLTRLVQCRKCHGPLQPDAPFCVHCRGAKASGPGPARGKLLVVLGAAALLVVLVLAGVRVGPGAIRAAKHGAASIRAAMPSLPPARPASLGSNVQAPASGPAQGAGHPASAVYDFRVYRPALLGDVIGGPAASVSGGPLAPPASPGSQASRAPHSRKSVAGPAAAVRPVVRRAALHVPAPGAEAWRRDGEIEERLSSLGMPDVRVMRKDRSLRLTGTVANDGDLRTLYRLIYDLGYGEVSYEVEVR